LVKNPSHLGIKQGKKTYWLFWKIFLVKIRLLWLFLENLLGRQIDSFDLWPKPYLGLTPELDFKIMIITTFIHMLIRVNSCWPSRPVTWALPWSFLKLGFKTLIIDIFILCWSRSIRVDPFDMWLGPCLESTP
jgi:hypothetical protein